MVWSKLAQARGGQTLFALAVRSIPNQIQRRARAKLFAVDAAKQLDDLRVPDAGARKKKRAAWRDGALTAEG